MFALSQLARRFPSVSIFDIDELLGQVRSVLDKVLSANVYLGAEGIAECLDSVERASGWKERRSSRRSPRPNRAR